jgi:hypothetical protein
VQLYQIGRLYCPRCLASRMFVGHDDPDPHAARCIDCHYQFGYAADPITGELRPVLSVEVVAKARAKLLEEVASDAASSGRSKPVRQAEALLDMPASQRREALARDPPRAPGSNWTPEQIRSFGEYLRTAGREG